VAVWRWSARLVSAKSREFFNRDRCLIRKGLEELNLVGRKRPDGGPAQHDRPEDSVAMDERCRHSRPEPGRAREPKAFHILVSHGVGIFDDDRAPLTDRAGRDRRTVKAVNHRQRIRVDRAPMGDVNPLFATHEDHHRIFSATEPDGAANDCVEHHLNIGWRAGDDTKDLAERGHLIDECCLSSSRICELAIKIRRRAQLSASSKRSSY
jgi:hypothetical protein